MRMSLAHVAPEGYQAVADLNMYVSASVNPTALALLKLRASMINGCAYCTDMHATHAARSGEQVRRLFALAAWHDAPFFTPRERAALALTDALTRLPASDDPVPDELWAGVHEHWSEREVADLILAIGTINVWNRIAVSTRIELPGE